MDENNNPFVKLSNLFVENQRQFNTKSNELSSRLSGMAKKLKSLNEQIDSDIFSANLVSILNIEEEATLILSVAKEVEFQRDQILNSVEVLTQSKKIKLNK